MLDTNPSTAAQLNDLLDPTTVSGARVAEFINVGEDMLFGATVIGDRYSVQDVVQFGGALARWIVAYLTIGPVLGRRTRAVTDEQFLSLNYTRAENYVESLRRGERVFYRVPFVPEAGLPGTTPQAPIPGVNPQLITQRAVRYFGVELNPAVFGSTAPPPGGGW
jgi:hypothetical protein